MELSAVCSAKESRASRESSRIGRGDWPGRKAPSSRPAESPAAGGVGNVWYWEGGGRRNRLPRGTESKNPVVVIGAPACREADVRVRPLDERAPLRGGRTMVK